jgi:FlaA1/EpsC-like NDP-sugar epimerase
MSSASTLKPEALAEVATGRKTSCFDADYAARRPNLERQLTGKRVLVIGGAGSIGGSVTRLLAGFETAALHIVDISENSLVELTRELRGSGQELRSKDIRWLPLDFGDTTMHRLIETEAPYDYVLNFAAVKHVRSEKDVYSVLHMLDVNVLKHELLLRWLAEKSLATSYFSVSTDKAANPVNLMGASKRLMEHVMFSSTLAKKGTGRVSSARFANVAFSDGSLLQGWILRLSKSQPLAVPEHTKRFFVSILEAGHLCMLAAFEQGSRQVMIPRMTAEADLTELESVAVRFLKLAGFEAERYRNDRDAIANVSKDLAKGRYPLLITPLDTSGEKPYEEFVGDGEKDIEVGMQALQAVPYVPPPVEGSLEAFVREVRALLGDPRRVTSKEAFVKMVAGVLGNFGHVETGKRLDERM